MPGVRAAVVAGHRSEMMMSAPYADPSAQRTLCGSISTTSFPVRISPPDARICSESRSAIWTLSPSSRHALWRKDAVIWAVSNGLIAGRGGALLAPGDYATRAEVCTILMKYLSILK